MFGKSKRNPKDFSDELEAHVALEAEQLRREGMTESEARAAAMRKLGNVVANREQFYGTNRWMWLDHLRQDLRLSVRQLAKHKGFTAVAVLTLALGIGANTAVFTLVHAVMMQSLPVPHPEELYRLGDADNCCVVGGAQGRHFSIFSYPLYLSLRDHTPEFQEMTAFMGGNPQFAVRRNGSADLPQPYMSQFIAGNYFATLGVRAAAGRVLTPEDDRPGAPPVAMMSYRVWQQQYGADPSVIGATFTINGAPLTIAGVTAPGFYGTTLRADPPDFWIPLADEPAVQGLSSLLARVDEHWLYILGRLKPGVNPAAVEAKVNVTLKQWLLSRAGANPKETDMQAIDREYVAVVAAPGGVNRMKKDYGDGLRLLMTISALVLVIACANIANLLLARRTAGRVSSSIRLALGASRGRIIRQTLTESILLALIGGLAGTLVAFGGAHALLLVAFRGASFIPIQDDPSLPVLGFTLLLSLITGVVFGAAPAWIGSRFQPAEVLRGVSRSTGNSATLPQKSLVVLQAALSLVLLAYAGLLTASLQKLEHQQFGFATTGRWMVKVNPAFSGYKPERIGSLYRRLTDDLSRIPGVASASFSLYSPMESMNWQSGVLVEGQPVTDPVTNRNSATWNRISNHYFETVGTRLIAGRTIDERDTPTSTRVAVINQAFARKYFPNGNPVGRHCGFESPFDYEIVGVVEDAKYSDARRPMWPMFFLPLLQMRPDEWGSSGLARSNYIRSIQVRASGNAGDTEREIRKALAGLDSNLSVLKVMTFGEQLAVNFNQERLLSRLTLLFGLLALVLAAVGLYGVTAYSVERRTSEIGIRVALGATRRGVIGLILRSAFLQVGIGLALGIPAALAGARLLASKLYGVGTYDPWMFGGAALALIVSAFLAGLIPANRAASIDPVKALRTE